VNTVNVNFAVSRYFTEKLRAFHTHCKLCNVCESMMEQQYLGLTTATSSLPGHLEFIRRLQTSTNVVARNQQASRHYAHRLRQRHYTGSKFQRRFISIFELDSHWSGLLQTRLCSSHWISVWSDTSPFGWMLWPAGCSDEDTT